MKDADVTSILAEHGLLLLQDATATSLATLVTGDVVKGSWWAHPKAQEIFRVAELLEDDTKSAKLVDGKVTLVHRRLWPALAAIGAARQEWQMRGLPAAARALLDDVTAKGRMRSSGKDAKELEGRLLVDAHQVHTDKGRHETELSPWEASDLDVTEAATLLEAAAKAIGAEGRLPWLAKKG